MGSDAAAGDGLRRGGGRDGAGKRIGGADLVTIFSIWKLWLK
uniref:Uncharacterized protein n=1 Tax=Candidatus Methanogaster sp. ANME-2c ERB4 TaxID=2759911 RepID=A0A7G9Y124_9EURY|nr:hypothetical protein NEBFCOPL_00009 [Methanosarcinales archaeon ANME-2c ERB4]